MAKKHKIYSSDRSNNAIASATKVVRDAKTGRFVTVKGVGALKDSSFKIKKGVSLLKPIARQALTERRDKHKAG